MFGYELCFLVEQEILNHGRSEVEFSGLPNMLPIPSDRDDICSESAAASR